MGSVPEELTMKSLLGLMISMKKHNAAKEQYQILVSMLQRKQQLSWNGPHHSVHTYNQLIQTYILQEISEFFSLLAGVSLQRAHREALRVNYYMNREARATLPNHVHEQMGQEVHNFLNYGLDPEDQYDAAMHDDIVIEEYWRGSADGLVRVGTESFLSMEKDVRSG